MALLLWMLEALGQGIIQLWPIITKIAALPLYFLRCRHHRITHGEGRHICPDCGEAVVLQWQVCQCAGCHQQRKTVNLWGKIQPFHNFCTSCGDTDFQVVTLKNPEFYQLHSAVLVVQNEQNYLNHLQQLFKHNAQTVSVWLEPKPATVALLCGH